MNEDGSERLKHVPGNNGSGAPGPDSSQRVKEAPGAIGVPAVSIVKKVYSAAVSVPEIKALALDRASRREAREQQQRLGRIAYTAIKAGLAIQTVRAVNTYAVHAVDQAQEEMMDIYYGKTRDPGMNEMMGQVVAQHVQQVAIQTATLCDLQFQRVTEEI